MSRIGGSRRKKVGIHTKPVRQKGKVSQRAYLQELAVGDKVTLKLEPAIQKASYLPRFHGRAGVITRKQGSCYYVRIMDGKTEKEVVAHPIHLKKA